jgi:hypothetical protein
VTIRNRSERHATLGTYFQCSLVDGIRRFVLTTANSSVEKGKHALGDGSNCVGAKRKGVVYLVLQNVKLETVSFEVFELLRVRHVPGLLYVVVVMQRTRDILQLPVVDPVPHVPAKPFLDASCCLDFVVAAVSPAAWIEETKTSLRSRHELPFIRRQRYVVVEEAVGLSLPQNKPSARLEQPNVHELAAFTVKHLPVRDLQGPSQST